MADAVVQSGLSGTGVAGQDFTDGFGSVRCPRCERGAPFHSPFSKFTKSKKDLWSGHRSFTRTSARDSKRLFIPIWSSVQLD